MGYCLINGTRYYKDDVTGELTKDNISQEAADRRARVNNAGSDNVSRIRRYDTGSNSANHTQSESISNRDYRNSTHQVRRNVPWGCIIVIGVIIAIAAAFVYNHTHISSEEQAIINYMNEINDGNNMNGENNTNEVNNMNDGNNTNEVNEADDTNEVNEVD